MAAYRLAKVRDGRADWDSATAVLVPKRLPPGPRAVAEHQDHPAGDGRASSRPLAHDRADRPDGTVS